MGVTFLVSPLSNTLMSRFGYRVMVTAATFICICSVLTSSFASNIYILPLTYSILWGIGAGIANHASLVILHKNVQNHKLPIANGIATSGSGFGTLALGPLLNYFLKEYNFRWAFRICCFFPLLFVPSVIFHIWFSRKQKNETVTCSLETSDDKVRVLRNNNDANNNVNNIVNNNVNNNTATEKDIQSTENELYNSLLSDYDASMKPLVLNEGLKPCVILQKKSFFDDVIDIEIWRNKKFIIYLLGVATFIFPYFTPFVFLVSLKFLFFINLLIYKFTNFIHILH